MWILALFAMRYDGAEGGSAEVITQFDTSIAGLERLAAATTAGREIGVGIDFPIHHERLPVRLRGARKVKQMPITKLHMLGKTASGDFYISWARMSCARLGRRVRNRAQVAGSWPSAARVPRSMAASSRLVGG
jgi:hypothetical protein